MKYWPWMAITGDETMNLFNEENTEGYIKEELDMLNSEWNAIAETAELEEGSDSYNRVAKDFCDAVAQRSLPPAMDSHKDEKTVMIKYFTTPPEFITTLGALCDELGVPIDAQRSGGLAPFCEADRDYPIVLERDDAGDWHVHTYHDQLIDAEWAPNDEQAARLYLSVLQKGDMSTNYEIGYSKVTGEFFIMDHDGNDYGSYQTLRDAERRVAWLMDHRGTIPDPGK